VELGEVREILYFSYRQTRLRGRRRGGLSEGRDRKEDGGGNRKEPKLHEAA
jgi:hypothetical protein